MKTIKWSNSVCTPDADTKRTAEQLLFTDWIYAGNHLVVDYARLMVVQGKISDLVIDWNGQIIEVNKYGAIPNWPDGFCNEAVDVASEILRLAMEKRKAERNNP